MDSLQYFKPHFHPRGPFLKGLNNFSGPQTCLMPCLHFRSKFQKCWKWYMQWNYQLPKQYYPVYELETVLLFKRLWFKNLPSGPKSYWAFREIGLRSVWTVYLRQNPSGNWQWVILIFSYQRDLNNIAFFYIFLRANYVITPKKFIMRVRENKCQISPYDILHNNFRILPVFSQFLSNLTFIFSGSDEK